MVNSSQLEKEILHDQSGLLYNAIQSINNINLCQSNRSSNGLSIHMSEYKHACLCKVLVKATSVDRAQYSISINFQQRSSMHLGDSLHDSRLTRERFLH